MIFTKEGEIKPFFSPPVRPTRVWICMEISCREAVLRWKVTVCEMFDRSYTAEVSQRCHLGAFHNKNLKKAAAIDASL